jgi:hypothetical protein
MRDEIVKKEGVVDCMYLNRFWTLKLISRGYDISYVQSQLN